MNKRKENVAGPISSKTEKPISGPVLFDSLLIAR